MNRYLLKRNTLHIRSIAQKNPLLTKEYFSLNAFAIHTSVCPYLSFSKVCVIPRLLYLEEPRGGHVVRRVLVRGLEQVRHQDGSAEYADDDGPESCHWLRLLRSHRPDQAREEADAVADVAAAQSRLLPAEDKRVDAVSPDGGIDGYTISRFTRVATRRLARRSRKLRTNCRSIYGGSSHLASNCCWSSSEEYAGKKDMRLIDLNQSYLSRDSENALMGQRPETNLRKIFLLWENGALICFKHWRIVPTMSHCSPLQVGITSAYCYVSLYIIVIYI